MQVPIRFERLFSGLALLQALGTGAPTALHFPLSAQDRLADMISAL